MPAYEALIEQNSIRTYFSKVLEKKRLSHAYMLSGAAGSGKSALMTHILFRLFCEHRQEEPCLSCPGCKKILADSHLDIKWIKTDNKKTGSIGVNVIRQRVCEDSVLRPFHGGYKVYVIEGAERMTAEAQNALLKALEEPPSYALFFLLCSNESALLETVKSRLIRLRLSPLSREGMEEVLKRHGVSDPRRLEELSAYGSGNPGLGLELLAGGKRKDRYEENLRILLSIGEGKGKELSVFGSWLLKREKDLPDFIDFCRRWYRDMLVLRQWEEPVHLYFPSWRKELLSLGRGYGERGIWKALAAIDRADENIRLQANRELLINQLLLDLYR